VVNGRTHYDVLGVRSDAPAVAIRESYRRLAREFHPDRTRGSAVGDRMPEINAAYHVLSDVGRRAVYDASLRGAPESPLRASSGRSSPVVDEPGDEAMREWRYQHPEGPARIPWRSLAFFSAIAVVAIVVLAQFTEPGEPAAPDGVLRNGDCVEILPNGDAEEIACDGAGDLVVRQFISFDRVCSNGWEAHRDRQGMGVACIERMPEPPPTL